MNLPQKVETIIGFVDKSMLCEGYKLPTGEKITTCSPHSAYSVRELSEPRSTEAFSTNCLIFSHIIKRCMSCKNLMLIDQQKKKRWESHGQTIHPKSNRRYLGKEETEKVLDNCQRKIRNANGRENYWTEKFTSEFSDMAMADQSDLRVMLDNIKEKEVPNELKCFWEQQEKINRLASPQGYRGALQVCEF